MTTTATPTQHKQLLAWIKESARLTQPNAIVWIDGSQTQRQNLLQQALASGEMVELDQNKMPGCYYHRSAKNDVARTESLTFICSKTKEQAGPTNNWMPPEEAYRKAGEIFKGSMRGRTMYVIPFSMGPVGSPFSKIGVELTDSIYVVLNMLIMTRAGNSVLEKLGDNGPFTKCLHGKADLNMKRRLILHFPEDNTIWSVGSGYGGNALLGKKCMALRIASVLGQKEGWMAEHMLILGIERPGAKTKYIVAAFPSACGKTNLAMLIPPEGLKTKGYRVWTVGDDIAWLRVGSDGQLYAVNPEAGYFGVVPGTNAQSNFNALKTIQKNTIFTNVALTPEKTVWWEGSDEPAPAQATDWKGDAWQPGLTDEKGKKVKAAHPNSRFTAPANQCPSIAPNWEDPQGVPVSAILFGGRRAHLAPLVYETFSWNHGVYTGATVGSERTAAAEGKVGEVRRDPMAMLPFCGYNMADYFAHWISMGKKIKKPPKIFHVNWFRQDKNGQFMWPGFGDNLRVLEWILKRTEDAVTAKETAIGYIPNVSDIDTTGLEIDAKVMDQLFAIDPAEWAQELEDQKIFFAKFGTNLPQEIAREHAAITQRFNAK